MIRIMMMDNYSENKTNQTIFGVTKSISQFLFKLTAIPLSVILMLMLSPVVCTSAFAQGEEQQEETHAHASSRKWKGINVNDDVIGQSQYATTGKTIFLYNVGTGRFIIEGGNFGMEGRLFHEDFGRPLSLKSDGYILSGVKENENKILFGCNIPGVFHAQGNWNNWNQYSFTVMMDADKSKRNKGWQFERVAGETGDTYTYYMYEEKNNKKYFLGAAWGECHAAAWKGDGVLVFMDDDRATWTSYDPRREDDKYEVDGDMITLDELYQWRVVSEEEFIDALYNEEEGLNPSISIFVPDRDFTRNAENFNTNWVMENKEGVDYTGKRYGYTYGVYKDKKTYNSGYYDNEAWNKPVRLKNVFDGDLAYGWENAKNGFLTFEGIGRTYASFKVPKAGWYQVQCYGFVQSDEGHDAYLFAQVVGGEESKNNLITVPAGTYGPKKDKAKCLDVGNILRKPATKEAYKNTVWICVTEDEFEGGQEPFLMVGVGKDEATQSDPVTNNNKTYYYDTDWVCIDDIRVTYLGTSPAFFYEEEESLDYLIPDPNNTKQFETSSPSNFGASEGQYGGAVCIERSLKTGQWNSFSFPMPLTGEQVRYAFGEDAQLARIDGIGTMSGNPNVIDFKKVSLRTTDAVVEPGHFYMLKPTQAPTTGIDPQGNNTTFYELGRFFFTVNENEPATYTPGRMNLSKKMDNETQKIKLLDPIDGEIVGKAGVNYVKTPGFESYHAGDEAEGIYAPKGSYVVSNNTIYHLNKDNPLKGFRGWIVLSNGEDENSKDYSMDVFGMFEEPVGGGSTGLPRIQLFSADESVYDLFGRKVGTLGTKLPKGIYIVKGKKFLVK
ncbi:MAG: hypothetical protein IKQ12_00025 [Prevotella sp.]|nr:hypothetical protein [Prevotella sp.]